MKTRTNTHKPMSSNSMRSTILSLSKVSQGSTVPSTETLQEGSQLHSNGYSYKNFHANLSTLRRVPRKSSQNATSSTLPKKLKIGLEQLSGIDLSEVRVHTNSSKPNRLGAIAYTQGTDIYLSPGQEKHLPHEAWHVVQQKQGRVKGKMQVAGFSINHEPNLEKEANLMGIRASQSKSNSISSPPVKSASNSANQSAPVQCFIAIDPNTWLNGRTPTERLLNQYFYDFEIHYEIEKLNAALEDGKKNIINTMANYYYSAYKQEVENIKQGQKTDHNDTLYRLGMLVEYINKFSLEYIQDDSDNYDRGLLRKGSWEDDFEAREAMLKMRRESGNKDFIKPEKIKSRSEQTQSQPGIPIIPYSIFKEKAPNNIIRLVRDIYFSWKSGKIFDKRSRDDLDARRITVDTPGALRSWHMNNSKSLPELPDISHLPPNAKSLHDHYDKYSNSMNTQNEKTTKISKNSKPIGYAEYTGTGIKNLHDSKIVLDYLQGKIYVTVSHYESFSKAREVENKGKYVKKGQTPGAGKHSAWFYIDMDR